MSGAASDLVLGQVWTHARLAHPAQLQDTQRHLLKGSSSLLAKGEGLLLSAVLAPAGSVLVHCAQGMSRSGCICIGYLMWRERLSRETALAHVQQARPVVDPNEGFDLQLREFERMNCDLSSWKGWDKQRLEQCFRRHHVSGRSVVHGFSDVIRRFHVHNITEDDTVFFDSTVML